MEHSKKFCLIDDSVSGIGGTSLTLEAIVEPEKDNVDFISTQDLCLKDVFDDYEIFIFGNILGFNQNSLDAIMLLMDQRRFVKIEFDYGYCQFRGEIPHEILGKNKCHCPNGDDSTAHLRKVYESIKLNALHVFYMSEGQMRIHDKHLEGMPVKKKSVLSSCFSTETMLKFKELRGSPDNGKYAIIDGNGGWHTQAKGINESIKYAKENNIEYDLIKTKTHDQMLNTLSKYKGLITFPIIHDTCPRITIEARYMGLEVITSEYSQHITEDWWKKSDKKAFDFTASRPHYFWETIKCLR
jgi:hypothetical protein